MQPLHSSWAAAGAAALLLVACGGNSGSGSAPGRGMLLQSPAPRVASLTADAFTADLRASSDGLDILSLSTGSSSVALPCGVDVQYLQYATVGGAGEPTTASGALMVPTGTDAKCRGARPILLYAHGTTITKRYNMAALGDPSNPAFHETRSLAALYAAQGYVVVAPNYAGYDSSPLPYHPYVNADQQSKDMIDALSAARTALARSQFPVSTSSKLFVSGYSQGGFVALATLRALQNATPPIAVTAAAPMSGPYALNAYMEAVLMGRVPLGSTAFAPLLLNSYKKSYPALSIYATTADVYEAGYASGIETLVPGSYDYTTVSNSGKLPATALFNSVLGPYASYAAISPPTGTGATDSLFALGFGPGNLVKNSYRFAFVADALARGDDALAATPTTLQPPSPTGILDLRRALVQNDLRNVVPSSPVLLCGGSGDPSVFYRLNTSVLASLWTARAVPQWSVLDVEATSPSSATNAATYQALFANTRNRFVAALPLGSDATAEVTKAYHGTLVPPACNRAAKDFFDARL